MHKQLRHLVKKLTFCAGSAALFVAVAGAAQMTCIVPNTVVLDIIPTGCDATMTNGPLTFTGVVESDGDVNNGEFDTIEFFNMTGNSVQVFVQGVDTDVTTKDVSNFAYLDTTTLFQTNPTSNTFSPDIGTVNFSLIHFIDPVGSNVTLKLNLGDSNSQAPSETSTVASSASDTVSPGNFTVTSFFDIFTELSIGGSHGYTVADDDFSNGSPGTGVDLQLQNFNPSSNSTLQALLTPEPASGILAAIALLSFAFSRRLKKA